MTIEHIKIGKHLIRENTEGYIYLLQSNESYIRISETSKGVFLEYPAKVSDRECRALATHNPKQSEVIKAYEMKKETLRKGITS